MAGSVITCKAAVAWGPKEPLVIQDVQVDPPQAGEIRIRITHTSLCHTDVTIWEGKTKEIFPRILGHEAAGIVESIGEGVSGFEVGDHVLPCFTGECTQCKYCKSTKTNLCPNHIVDPDLSVMRGDKKSRFSANGKPIYHFMGTSTFSEYTVVDEAQVIKVNKDAPLSKICLLSCGISTGVGAVLNTAKVEKGSKVAVFGLGAIGLAVVIGAKMAGASQIIGIDLNPAKFAKAKAVGATDFLNPKELDRPVEQVIQAMTEGGVDYSFECVGNVEVMKTAFDSCQIGWGMCVIIGVDAPSKRLSIAPTDFFSGRIFTGTIFGGIKPKTQLPHLVDLCMSKELQFDEVITHELPFAEINQAFSLLLEGKSLRCVLSMS